MGVTKSRAWVCYVNFSGNMCTERQSNHFLVAIPTPTPTATPMIMTMSTGSVRFPSPKSNWRHRIGRPTNDPEADPLLPSRRSCFDHCSIEMFIPLVQINHSILRLILNILYSGLLRNDRRFHVLEKLGQLYHLPLNLLNSFVPALNRAQC